MRDRLIELLTRFSLVCSSYCEELPTKNTCRNCSYGQFADYLIANGVIVLPCDFLQKCYVLPTIENGLSEMTEMKCIGFMLSPDSYVANLVNDKNKLYQPSFGRFGKTIFFSREEAKANAGGGKK